MFTRSSILLAAITRRYQFKLIDVYFGEDPETPDELEYAFMERRKSKPFVTLTINQKRIRMDFKSRKDSDLDSTHEFNLSTVSSILTSAYHRRLLGLSFYVSNGSDNGGTHQVSFLLLGRKYCSLKRRNFTAEDVSNVIQVNKARCPPTVAEEAEESGSDVAFSDASTQREEYQFTEEEFDRESYILRRMGMVVPLDSQEAAECSRSSTFEYIPLHVQDPSLRDVPSPLDHNLPNSPLEDIDEIPEIESDSVSVKSSYEEVDYSNFHAYDMTYQDFAEQAWFSGKVDTRIFVNQSQNNGLQYFPPVPTKSFINRMEKLFNAYLQPKMYHERNLGISTHPRKIARYLTSCDFPDDGELANIAPRHYF